MRLWKFIKKIVQVIAIIIEEEKMMREHDLNLDCALFLFLYFFL